MIFCFKNSWAGQPPVWWTPGSNSCRTFMVPQHAWARVLQPRNISPLCQTHPITLLHGNNISSLLRCVSVIQPPKCDSLKQQPHTYLSPLLPSCTVAIGADWTWDPGPYFQAFWSWRVTNQGFYWIKMDLWRVTYYDWSTYSQGYVTLPHRNLCIFRYFI